MAKVSPVNEAAANEELDDEVFALRRRYAEMQSRKGHQKFFGCDLRRTPIINHMREAAGEGQLTWLLRHHLHTILSFEWKTLTCFLMAFSVLYCGIFGVLLQLAAHMDHLTTQQDSVFSPESDANEGVPIYDGRWGYGSSYSQFLRDVVAPSFKGFMLSLQTFLTIGYGVYGPDGFWTQVVIIIELGLGLVVTAIVTGVPYLKFSIPYPAFGFSNKMVVGWFNDKPTIKCRFTMKRLDRVTNVRLRMDFMLENVTLQGVPDFTIKKMKLVTSEAAHAMLAFTVQHVLTDDSPLFKFWKRQAAYPDKTSPQPYVQVTVLAVDNNLQADILDTHMYSLEEDLKWDYVFKDMTEYTTENGLTFHYDNLHHVEPWPDPETCVCDILEEDDPSQFSYPILRHAKLYQESMDTERGPLPAALETKTTVETKTTAQQTQTRGVKRHSKAKRISCCQKKEDRSIIKFNTVGVKNKCLRNFYPENIFSMSLKTNFCVIALSAFIPLLSVSALMTLVLVLFDEGCYGFFSKQAQTGVYSSSTNCSTKSIDEYYADLFYFSMQTVSTVGYGSLAPYTTTSQIVSSAFGLLGFVTLALACGLIFARYAQPEPAFVISNNACITTRNGERRLEFRVASTWSKRPIVKASAKCFLYRQFYRDEVTKKVKGRLNYQQFALQLEEDGEHPFLRFPATFAHVIKPPEDVSDDDLCLYHLKQKDWEERSMGLNIVLTGWDTCLQKEVYAFWEYKANQIKFNRHFLPCYSYEGASSGVTIDMRNFHATAETNVFFARIIATRLFLAIRSRIRSRLAIKEWLRSFIADATQVQSIVNNAMDQGLDSLEALAEAGRQNLLELGITQDEIDEVMNALESYRGNDHEIEQLNGKPIH